MLYIFGGLPGTGKSTLSIAFARHCNAFYIRIDTIEQAVRNAGITVNGPIGYSVGYGLALDNLRLGNSVVADSVNPLGITREAWIDVARQAQVPYVEIEIICSDMDEHRRRIESREVDVAGLKLPDWKGVMDREYEVWSAEHIVLDTAGRTVAESISNLLGLFDK
jgi:predicted kinase